MSNVVLYMKRARCCFILNHYLESNDRTDLLRIVGWAWRMLMVG